MIVSGARRYQLRFLAGMLFLGGFLFIVLWWNRFPVIDSLIDAAHSTILLSLTGMLLFVVQFNFHSKKPLGYAQLGLIAALTSFVHLSEIYVLSNLIDPAYFKGRVLDLTGLRYLVAFLFLLGLSLYWWILKNAETQEKIQQQLLEQERALTHAELVNINNQLQPHFLFNSLNSISALTLMEPKEANRMIHLLSDFLRGTLRKDYQQLVHLNDELNQAKLFLEIEKIRYGQRLSIETNIDEKCLNAQLPTLILQPLVENALKHGLNVHSDTITLHISAKLEESQLYLVVTNPCDEDLVPQYKGTGYGIESVKKRLFLFFKQHDLIKINKEKNVFTVTLRIPQAS